MEIWKKIDEVPYIEVSNMGRFRTVDRIIEKTRLGKKIIAHKKGGIRKLSKDNTAITFTTSDSTWENRPSRLGEPIYLKE